MRKFSVCSVLSDAVAVFSETDPGVGGGGLVVVGYHFKEKYRYRYEVLHRFNTSLSQLEPAVGIPCVAHHKT